MNEANARKKFNQQVNAAKNRGIGFHISFDEWLLWWGNDIEKRGVRLGDLQMCRFKDDGDYVLGNVYKGTVTENHKTAHNIKAKKNSDRKKREHQAYLDALMWAASKEPHDEDVSEDQREICVFTGSIKGPKIGATFAADKRR